MHRSASKVDLRAIRRSLTRRLWCDENLPADIADAIWDGEMERLLYSSAPLQVKDRCIAVRYDHPAGPLLIKQHTWGGASRTFRSVGREASARRCGRLGLLLGRLGIPTPLPRACLEQRIGPWGFRSYLVTDYVEGTSLYRYIRFGKHEADKLRHVARQVARIWQQMVEGGISHNDMKPENFIVDQRHNVWLIDLEKVRLNEKPEQQRKRSICDVRNFLHIRGWHGRAEAREVFLREFRSTPYGSWLDGVTSPGETDPTLSVLMLIDGEPDVLSMRRAIESVRDIADEVVLLEAGDGGGSNFVDRIVLCGQEASGHELARPAHGVARYQWVLVLQQNEIVTPFLAKELQQRIADTKAEDAIRIPIEPQFFGHNVVREAGDKGRPIRLFRQARCAYSLANGELVIAAEVARTGQLAGTVQRCACATMAEFVERLNERTTRAAHQRWQAGQRPAVIRSLVRAIGRTLKLSAGRGGIGSGWTGLQIAFLRGVFSWLEEIKLRHMSRDFFADVSRVETVVPSSDERPSLPVRHETALRKAA
jgi:(heptosyl)LPS beta-1,4-glucosyltransferase